VYGPAGTTLTDAVPLQLEQVAGVLDGVSVNDDEVQGVHVVLKYMPITHKLKQSPPDVIVYAEVVCPVVSAVFTLT
jgi:hypothetical protein